MATPRSSPPPLSDVALAQEPATGAGKPTASIDLSFIPPVLVLSAHLSPDEVHEIEDKLTACGATITYDVTEAKIILGKIANKKRAQLELRTRKLYTEEINIVKEQQVQVVLPPAKQVKTEFSQTRARMKRQRRQHKKPRYSSDVESESSTASDDSRRSRRRRSPSKAEIIALEDSSTESEADLAEDALQTNRSLKRKRDASATPASSPPPLGPPIVDPILEQKDAVCVIKLQWLEDAIADAVVKPMSDYTVLVAKRVTRPNDKGSKPAAASRPPADVNGPLRIQGTTSALPGMPRFSSRQSILQRARAEADIAAGQPGASSQSAAPYGERRFNDQGRNRTNQPVDRPSQSQLLMQHNTSSYEGTSETEIPPPPEWVKKGIKYACQRVTPADSPNKAFIAELEKIKLARLLTADEIGVRAYSTSIASLRAYPYKISAGKEILQLPGCNDKIANLWIEMRNSGEIKAAKDADNDETLKALRDFYGIWGVGATTAREFYYDRGWRDRDDIVEYGWSTLSRVQQIGVKYYDEFLDGISRTEVEAIAARVREHAVQVRDEGIEILVVGGYRRGKEKSGDVDIIVSHRQLLATAGLIDDIVKSLEAEKWITHTLTLALTTTERQQSTLPFKTADARRHQSGFDTLDKALVVWQDPNYDTGAHEKNPNPHRRVDIIVSPWRTVGCAVLGWSGGTTFQRDIRQYCKDIKNWKFDSSGIRDRSTGDVVQLEGAEGVGGSMIDAEKMVFAGLGLEYREPSERCTG